MTRSRLTMAVGLLAVAAGCSEVAPTSVDEDLLPPQPVTLEVRLGWDAFASGLQVLGGYGSPQELGSGVVARAFDGRLDARTLVRFTGYPRAVAVRDSAGSVRSDSLITFPSGRVVVVFDTLASIEDGPVNVRLGALGQPWHARTATWTLAVDTINDPRAWGEPGAGPVVDLGSAIWDPAEGDSVVFPVDSAQIEAWSDTLDTSRGVRIDALTEGVRLKVNNAFLRLDVRSTIDPDTALVLTAPRRNLTFIYDPVPAPPPDGIRIGGAPAWRTVLDVNVPRQVTGPASLCARVACPLTLTKDNVGYAAIVLRTRRSEPGFQPSDTVNLDVRPVLQKDALPKSPLGSSLTSSLGRRVGPSAFGEDAGREVEIPITAFLRALLAGETESGEPPPSTLALLSTFEPLSIAFASFFGPGTPEEPVLKLIVTSGSSVQLP